MPNAPALLALLALMPATAMAATITVDSTSTAGSLPNACTLRAAIVAATAAQPVGGCPAGDPQPFNQSVTNTIVLPVGGVFTFSSPVGATGFEATAVPEIAIQGPLVVEGRGATIERSDQLPACVTTAPPTPDQFRLFRLFGAGPLASLTLRDLTLRNGCTSGAGAAILVDDGIGSLVLERVRVVGARGNTSGAITFVGNGDLVLRESHFLQNVATSGAIVRVSVQAGRIARIEKSTFSDNTATGQVVFVSGVGSVVLRDSTVSGNTTTGVGATGQTVSLSGAGTLDVLHNTFADNQKASTNAQLQTGGSGTLRLQGNWLADTTGPNCTFTSGTIAVTGANLSTDTSCTSFAQVSPGQMRPLGNYGGFVPTRPPLAGSVAIDVSTSCNNPATNQPLGTDARGVPRPQDGDQFPGALCDAGAAEFVRNQAPSIALPPALATLAAQPVLIAPPIELYDPDARDEPVELRLDPANGVVDFDALQLDCTTGDGNADPVAVCRGSIADLNVALAGLTYTPRVGFTGADLLAVEVNDLGAGGDDGTPRGDARDLAIQVVASAPLATIAGPIVFGQVTVGTQSQPVTFTIANDGNAQLVVQVPSLPVGSPFRIQGTCPPLPPTAACQLQAFFSPTVAATASTFVDFTSNAANSPTRVELIGVGVTNADVILSDGFERID